MFKFSRPFVKTAVVGTASLLLLTGAASAQLLTQSFTNDTMVTSADTDASFALPSFNSSLGTLESVTVTVTDSAAVDFGVFNPTDEAINFTNGIAYLPGMMSGPGVVDSGTLHPTLPSGTAAPGFTSYLGLRASGTDTLDVSPLTFAAYEDKAPGITFNLASGTDTYAGKSPAGRLLFGGQTIEDVKTTVTYTYLVTPEPSEKYLVALVALAMVLVLVRRKSLRA